MAVVGCACTGAISYTSNPTHPPPRPHPPTDTHIILIYRPTPNPPTHQLPPDALAALRGLEGMRELDLRGLEKLTDDTLGAVVARNGATLQALRLRGCRALTNEVCMGGVDVTGMGWMM